MFTKHPRLFLLASPDAAVLSSLEPEMASWEGQVEVVRSFDAAKDALAGDERPILAVLDTALCGAGPEMNLEPLLATACAAKGTKPISIVLISDTVTQNWIKLLAEGVIDDLILRDGDVSYWRVRLRMVLQNRRKAYELERLREFAALHARIDHLTGVYNREATLSMLFRETDRLQRTHGVLSLLLLDLDGFGNWNSRLGNDSCDDLLCQVVARLTRLQRSYDVLGRQGMDEFLLVLPGCSIGNAALLAERIRTEVFGMPFQAGDESIRLSACFGIANSKGRSPVVVLREAERALEWAQTAGPESIECFADLLDDCGAGMTFLSGVSGKELLAW